MDIGAFLVHLAYIAVTFGGGLLVGYLFKDKLETLVHKYFNRK